MMRSCSGAVSLTNFKRHTTEYLDELHRTGQPLVFTVDGKAEVVVQDAAAYRELVESAALAERKKTLAAVRAGLADAKAGRTKPAKSALARLAKKHGVATPNK